MSLSDGTRLGAYEITGQIGSGGMGEVYRATDTRLGREIAIKTLPAALASDKDRLARFEREARLLASLNHAHIASVHSLDEQDGTLYIAMELVEGETLEAKLKAGALAVEDALELALQISLALEAAHEKGVVHRDLKPANILITPDDVVKVLDFGLAKAFSGNPNEASPANSPTLSMAMTQQGLILGTAAYMSPEQASGQATDQRADIWAFGVVLYEMLTGIPAFGGESVQHVLADVLKSEPDWGRLPENLHPRLRFLLERCLAKKPRNRLHSIADARVEIEAVLRDPKGVVLSDSMETQGPPRSLRRRWVTASYVAGALIASGFAAGVSAWYLKPSAPKPVVRFTEDTAARTPFFGPVLDISPDGLRIAYAAATPSGQLRIYIRDLDETVTGTVDGVEGVIGEPRFSPDGQWLAYLEFPTSLWTVPIGGGAPRAVTDRLRVGSLGIDWDDSGMLLFTQPDGIYEVPATGGEPRMIVAARDGETLASPHRLPGSDAVLFTAAAGNAADADAAEIVVYSPSSGERTVVWSGRDARYVASGHLIYAQGDALFAVPFDVAGVRVTGTPVRVVDDGIVRGNGPTDSAQYAVSDTGSLVTVEALNGAPLGANRKLVWLDRDGTEQPIALPAGSYNSVQISPDGQQVAIAVVGAPSAGVPLTEIWVLDDVENPRMRQITFDLQADQPVWSADGDRIYFRSLHVGADGVYSISADGGPPELIARNTPDFNLVATVSLSPDGETLGLANIASFSDFRIATLGVRPGSEFNELLPDASFPVFSPNGSWIAYMDGLPESIVTLRPYPDVQRGRIPVARGRGPRFSVDGLELFYIADGALWSVAVQYDPLRTGTPEMLFRVPNSGTALVPWDRHPDGERFLFIEEPDAPADEAAAEPGSFRLHVVVNWLEELNERVPAN